jgi:hypothetical protein
LQGQTERGTHKQTTNYLLTPRQPFQFYARNSY